ncbi:class I SAM-dependent methyltransferase [Kineosporia babensis]|uniref:Class I SAM-dependent methyltransferase n=1 Tax=Kineosporia babensis TaxID=499548 RepID=A0A9X1NIL7_9ACTN|nr:class I SAM-dependent methyltransferase [Kineosporia babensis]MCD5313911.1 class I SAM-dependent methyltransferase [Kineosporia babensis]
MSIALDLITRWDAQQTGYIRHRAERFATIARVVSSINEGVAAPRILDLAGGPGSLARAVLAEIPGATAVVADKDPLLVAIAADLAETDPRLQTAHVDLDDPEWAQHPLIAQAPFDAVVSSTALHWLKPDKLVAVYWKLAEIIRPGGIFLNGDNLYYDERTEPTLHALAKADDEQFQAQTFTNGVDTWEQWWAAAEAVPHYAEAVRLRAATWGEELHVAPPKVSLGFHLETLRSAGFAETGTVWRYLDDHVVYGLH